MLIKFYLLKTKGLFPVSGTHCHTPVDLLSVLVYYYFPAYSEHWTVWLCLQWIWLVRCAWFACDGALRKPFSIDWLTRLRDGLYTHVQEREKIWSWDIFGGMGQTRSRKRRRTARVWEEASYSQL